MGKRMKPQLRDRTPPIVLTIAGSDSGAGAGIQADARTIHALGGFACTAITAVTVQDTRRVISWQAVPTRLIAAQAKAVLNDLAVAAIKTGLLPGATGVRAVIDVLPPRPRMPLVVDPVIGSTSGTRFLSPAGVRILVNDLLPRAWLVTPNWPEAEALSGRPVRSFEEAESAARQLADAAGCAVLVKGGHAPGEVCHDCLVLADGSVQWFESDRVRTTNTHGTGCVLSAAIATRLAFGDEIVAAVTKARAFLHRALANGRTRRWGAGHGPAFAGAR